MNRVVRAGQLNAWHCKAQLTRLLAVGRVLTDGRAHCPRHSILKAGSQHRHILKLVVPIAAGYETNQRHTRARQLLNSVTVVIEQLTPCCQDPALQLAGCT
jgi:hypothetical protein